MNNSDYNEKDGLSQPGSWEKVQIPTKEERAYSMGWNDYHGFQYNPPYTPDKLFYHYQRGWTCAETVERCDFISEFKIRPRPGFNNIQ